MSETTTAATKTAEKTVKAVSESLPTVVDTVELALDIPTKAVLSQKLVVSLSVVAGAAIGAGVLFGVNKWRSRKPAQDKLEVPNDLSELDDEAKKA